MSNNKSRATYWLVQPVIFSSIAVLSGSLALAGGFSSQATSHATTEPRQVGSANYEYVGGRTQVGGYITDDGDVSVDINHAISETQNSSTSVGLWAGMDLDEGDEEKGGVQLNHNWVSRDKAGQARHVNKLFAAYDRNQDDHEKATLGYGREYEDIFWEGRVSKGLSGMKETGLKDAQGKTVYSRAYDYGVGASVGKYNKHSNTRVRAGLDHEWGDEVGTGEKDATNTTLSAGVEKFFAGTPHSISLDVAASRKNGGTVVSGYEDDTDVSTSLGYRYDFGGTSVYQSGQGYRRVRVELPGKATPPRYERQPIYKRVPTYKHVPVYAKKEIKKAHQELVKTTMELEGETFFRLNSAKLVPSAKQRLLQIASEIRRNGYKGSIRITGNTCGLGDPAYDQRLSEQRAQAVKKFLIKKGFNPDHLVARGLGKFHPKYPNTPSEGFKNRRVDIEYVTDRHSYKTVHRSEQKTVKTGTRQVISGYRNVPAGYKNVMIDSGKQGSPRVIWRTEVVKTTPPWIKRALHNNIRHDRNVNTYLTTRGNTSPTEVLNTLPVANGDSATTACNQPVTINVLANDSDVDSDILSIASFTQGASGSVTLGTAGELVYTPDSDSCGLSDSFNYTISDGNGGTATATVTVQIDAALQPEPENQAPVAVNDNAMASCSAITIDVLKNDSDPDGDKLNLVKIGKSSLGSAVISGDSIIYTPDKNCGPGTDTFSYTVSDGELTANAMVSVAVKNAGCASECTKAEPDDMMTYKNQPVTINVLQNDAGSGLGIVEVDDPKHGTATIVGDTIVYKPDHGYTGTDSFWYAIKDPTGYEDAALVLVYVEESGCGYESHRDKKCD